MKPQVHILVTIPDEASFDACTLVFPSLRVGFPTADIFVTLNPVLRNQGCAWDLERRFKNKTLDKINKVSEVNLKEVLVGDESLGIHHADWIRQCVESHDPDKGPLVILDADTWFWKSVEDWHFTTLLAGYYVPKIWNDFAKCVSVPRIHTSFMWFSDTKALLKIINDRYPHSVGTSADYNPCDPFRPRVQFLNGTPVFWDTCANLFEMIGYLHCTRFTKVETDCFEHINSASFFDVMRERLDVPTGIEFVHRELIKNPENLKGQIWPVVNAYYQRKHQQALSL